VLSARTSLKGPLHLGVSAMVHWVDGLRASMGILFLADGAGIGCANWVLRAIVRDLAPVLTRGGARELAEWLTGETSHVELYGHLDVRELTPENQEAFRKALEPALIELKARGPTGWSDPSHWGGYLALFESLVDQASLVARGEKPKDLPNLSGVCEYDGSRCGPGWAR